MRFKNVVLCLGVALLIFSCDRDDGSPEVGEKRIIEAYIDSMGIDATLEENGVYQYLIAANTNPNLNNYGEVFRIQYELYELDGKLIDSVTSNTSDTVVILKQGSGAVYPVGIDLALNLMDAGETRGFIIPSALAYGSLDLAGITHGAILHAIITAVSISTQEDYELEEEGRIAAYIEGDTLNNGTNPNVVLPQGLNMRYKTTQGGVSGTGVVSGDTVSITYTMRILEGEEVDVVGRATPFTFIVDGEQGVILGLNVAVKQMALNERATIVLPSRAAYYYSAAVIPHYLIDNDVVAIEDNPLITEEILPTYTARLRPYEILSIDLELIRIN